MDKNITFEDAMQRLSEVTKSLENEKLPLDESIELYKEGMELAALCKSRLDNAKMQISVLDESGNERIYEADE